MKRLVLIIALVSSAAWAGMVCQIDGRTMTYTGQTVVQMGQVFKVYRCPLGHEQLGK